MRKKWKYDNSTLLKNLAVAATLAAVFLISSCMNREKHKHIATNKINDLEELVQPANQAVLSNVKTVLPTQASVTPELYATGVISYDPHLLNNISARFNGRIEKLYVRFNFQSVTKGQRLMDIYSPEILTAQQNLIFLLNNAENDMTLINSSKQKLELLGLTPDQVQLIEKTRQPINPLPIFSPYSGHIHDIGTNQGIATSSSSMGNTMSTSNTASNQSQPQIENIPSSQNSELSIKEGMYVQSGQALFAVYNVAKVWAVLNIFPRDASLIKIGDKVNIKAETNPDHVIQAAISYIEPVTGQNASAIKARVYLNNAENMHLKIGILLSAKIISHPITGLWLPRKAVVDLGPKQVVFMKIENHFLSKVIQTGFATDSIIQITSGLQNDDRVAENAQFLVDSESFIQTDDHEEK